MPKQVQVPVLVTVWVPEGTRGTVIAEAVASLVRFALAEKVWQEDRGLRRFETPAELLTLSMGLADVEIK